MNNKSLAGPMWFLISIVLALIILVIASFMFYNQSEKASVFLNSCESRGGECKDYCDSTGRELKTVECDGTLR
jgi:uncharacterized membrane protein YqiK